MSGRVRVLQVITSLAGGAGQYACDLARHLDARHFQVDLAYGPGYPLDEAVCAEQLPHVLLGWGRRAWPGAVLRGARDLARLMREQRYDVVHAHCSIAGAVGRVLARRQRGTRVVFTMHAFASRDFQPAWRKRVLLGVERALDRCTDHYVATTERVKRQIVDKRIAASERISVVPLGIPLPPLPVLEQRLRARRLLGVREDEVLIGTAGRLETQKGVAYLVRAFAQLHAALPATRLAIFGDGPLRPALAAEVRRLGLERAVLFAGWRDDMAAIMCALDVFCLASLWETFGYVLLEAMAAGVPVVATDVDGIPEVTDGGRCAALVPPADAQALAAALSGLIADAGRRAGLAAAGRARVEREFALPRMIAGMEALYETLTAAARPALEIAA